MLDGRLDRAAVAIGVAGMVLCFWALLFGRVSLGFQVQPIDGRLVVVSVRDGSTADQYGVEPGLIALDDAGHSPVEAAARINAGEFAYLDFVEPAAFGQTPDQREAQGLTRIYADYGMAVTVAAQRMLPLSLGMLLVGSWWLRRQRSGSPFHRLAVPIAVATTMPFVLEPLGVTRDPAVIAVYWLVAAVSVLPLALGLLAELPTGQRRALILVVLALLGIAAVSGLMASSGRPVGVLVPEGTVLLLVSAMMLPALAAAAHRYSLPSAEGDRGRVVPALESAVAGITPAIALVTFSGSEVRLSSAVPAILWILAVMAANRFTVHPLLRSVVRAQEQRDMVLAAMEAQRSRIAADIHDEALQEISLLGWRLDAAGDAEGAAMARHVSERLRAICGDLRLPILDDLGAGPALEWLVERIERLAGGDVRLERGDQVRPPADVELAFFRIAQEALANAVRHGRPPIVVRYWSSPSGASLSINDAGAGIESKALKAESGGGSFGLTNMRQRAEQIGALLDIRRWPQGGTQVALEWRAP